MVPRRNLPANTPFPPRTAAASADIESMMPSPMVLSPASISFNFALLCALSFTVSYIAPFYLSPTLRTTSLIHRDDHAVIRARVRAVVITCTICTTTTALILTHYAHTSPLGLLRLFGIWPLHLFDALRAVSLCAALFVGPLYEQILVNGDWRQWSLSAIKQSFWDDWVGYRNCIVAPVSEELVFRSLIIAIYLQTATSPVRIVFTTPLIFGLAHVHHLIDFLRWRIPPGRTCPDGTVWMQGIVRSLVQFSYTSLFGFFVAFVYLRTGNLLAVTGAHMFCNWQGVPRLWGRIGQFQTDAHSPSNYTPDIAQGRSPASSETHVPSGPQDLGSGWTVVYYALLFVGMFAFYTLLWPWTESTNALVSF